MIWLTNFELEIHEKKVEEILLWTGCKEVSADLYTLFGPVLQNSDLKWICTSQEGVGVGRRVLPGDQGCVEYES